MLEKDFIVLDLFSGAGGMAEGFIQAGFKIPFATDQSLEASQTYKNRHNQLGYELSFYQGDIRNLTRKKSIIEFVGDKQIDVIVGGPPCQGFSLTGKRDENDPRNRLFLEYLKIVKLVRPKYFVIENVEGILSYRLKKIKGISNKWYENELVTEIIREEAYNIGYVVRWKLLNAADFGVPQNRLRVIFIGHQIIKKSNGYLDAVVPPKFPSEKNSIITVEEAISDLRFLKKGQMGVKYDNRYKMSRYQNMLRKGLTPGADGKPIEAVELTNHLASNHLEKTVQRFKLLQQGESVGSLLERLSIQDYKAYYTKKYRCTKLDPSSTSPTVLTLPDDIVHYDENNPRILTVREFARLQSFDDSFEFLGKRTTGGSRRKYETPQYTQVGNAVPPLLARAIAEELMIGLQTSYRVHFDLFVG